MLLLETIETIGCVWLAMSAIAFILGAAFVRTRQEFSTSAALEPMARPDLRTVGREAMSRGIDRPDDLRVASDQDRNHIGGAKKRAVYSNAPARRVKAA